MPPLIERQQRQAIIAYLSFCKQTRQRATVDSARQFMAEVQTQRHLAVSALANWKEAIRWFFRDGQPAAPRPAAPAGGALPGEKIGGLPSLGRRDLGQSGWEERLVAELRRRQYRWRTEQTYRGWARRFAQWLAARGATVDQAGEGELRDFLSELATHRRVSAGTQKQALNALVFLLREALGRPLGQFGEFTRARISRRVPVVLSREECQRLFAALAGTTQLMAELMYGRVKAFGSRGLPA